MKEGNIPKMTECNIPNRTLFIKDNLDILTNINSETADLIYLDPPFNSNRIYSAPIGSKAAGASFKDAWTLDDLDHAWVGQIAESHPKLSALINAVGISGGKGDMAYLTFMARRLLEMRRILKPAGSLYLHCDPTMGHSLKLVLDCIFGKRNFRNEIVWCYTGPSSPGMRNFPRKHDIIFRYAKSGEWVFNNDDVRVPYKDQNQTLRRAMDAGKGTGEEETEKYRRRGKLIEDWWSDITVAVRSQKENTGYPTQKPLALLRRIIMASSNEGDLILDPFCGCATTLVEAERLNRRWIGIDISSGARVIIKRRLEESQDLLTTKGVWKKVDIRTDIPIRTDKGESVVNPKAYKHELYGMQKGLCAGCRLEFQFRNMEIDHIFPQSKGGGNLKDNLQLICGACNRVKGDRTMDYLLAELRKQGITG